MTREEIIDFCEMKAQMESENEDIYNAIIKALEQEPTTKNDLGVDCISRQEVLRLLANSIGKTNTYLQTKVLKMPSVTPQESRKGYWIEHPHEAGPCWEYSRYECSECHDWAEDDSDYCPYCGADMREVEE